VNTIIAINLTILLGVFYCWTSRINGLYFFGRTADASLRNSEEGRAVTRQYLVSIVMTTIAAACVAWLGGNIHRPSLSAASFLIELVAFSIIFARANAKVRTLSPETIAASRQPVIQVALLEQPTYWIPGSRQSFCPLPPA
jgi:hypothetical protein